MNCDRFKEHLDDWLDGALENGRLAAFLTHLDSCPSCHQEATLGLDIAQKLRALPVPPMPADLSARLLGEKTQSLPRTYSTWAAAACLVLALLTGAYLTTSGAPQAPPQWISLVPMETDNVTLALTVGEDISEASFTLVLPASIELEGFPKQREVQWVTPLKKGVNRLQLPLVASQNPGGELELRVKHGDKQRILKIGIRTDDLGRRAS